MVAAPVLLPKALRWSGVLAIIAFLVYYSIVTTPEGIAAPVDTVYEDSLIPEVGALAQWRHFLAYGTLSWTLAYALDGSPHPLECRLFGAVMSSRRLQAAVAFSVAVLFGIGIEIAQYLTPHRVFDVNDIVANTLGASLVVVYYAARSVVEFRPISVVLSDD